MTINADKAFDVDPNGFVLRDNDGNVVFYLTSGTGDPTGSPAPVNSYYFDQSTFLLWYKYGAGDNDWRKLRALDLDFDPTLSGFDGSITNVQDALDLLKAGGGSGVSGTVVGGKGGNLTAGSFFDNQNVPMNITPFDLSLKNVVLRTVTFRNEKIVTGTLDIEYYDINTLTWVVGYTINLTASDSAIIRGLSVIFPDEPQLRYKTNMAIKNPKLVANFNGDSAT